MRVEAIVKVELENDEKEALKQVDKIVNIVFSKTNGYQEEIEYEDDVRNMLEDLYDTIKRII